MEGTNTETHCPNNDPTIIIKLNSIPKTIAYLSNSTNPTNYKNSKFVCSFVKAAPINSFENYTIYYEMRNFSKWEDIRLKILSLKGDPTKNAWTLAAMMEHSPFLSLNHSSLL